MKRIKKIKYEWNQLSNDCWELAERLRKAKIIIKNVYGVPRGGLVPAVILSHLLYKPLLINRDFIDGQTLIVDDISDKGSTLKNIVCNLDKRVSEPKVVTLWIDENTKYKPLFHCRVKKETEWIIFPFETLRSSKLDN